MLIRLIETILISTAAGYEGELRLIERFEQEGKYCGFVIIMPLIAELLMAKYVYYQDRIIIFVEFHRNLFC